MSAPARFEVDGLALSYHGVPALADLSLAVPAGQVTALVGPSGCGKSSFLMALNRLTDLIPGCRVSGSLRFDGRELHAPDVDVVALRRRIGMIFQRPNPFPISIRRNLQLPLVEHGLSGDDRGAARIEAALRRVGLWDEVADRLDAPAQQLSGGQQQRLCLARALVLEPTTVLLDEPTSALDPLASAVVEDLIASLRGRYTVVIVTHNLAQARRLADRVALFWVSGGAGRIVEAAPAEDFFTRPAEALTAAYVSGRRG